MQFTVRWEGDADLDLHVVGPDGEEIYFDDPASSTGGRLDVDACEGGCSEGEDRVENVFWPDGEAPAGSYTVWVDHFDGESADFELVVRIDGEEVVTESDSLSDGESERIAVER